VIASAKQLPIETAKPDAGITWDAAMIWAGILLDAVEREVQELEKVKDEQND